MGDPRRLGRRLLAAMVVVIAGLVAGRAGADEPAPPPLRVVAFGTSLTARGGWQVPLREALAACARRDVAVDTVARSGASSRWALTMVDAVTALGPGVVLVEFSVNDAAVDRLMRVSWSEANIREIVRRLRAGAPQARIVLMAMNPVIGMRGAIRPFLDDYYDAYARVAADEGLLFIDHRPRWRALGDAALAEALPDGSHPVPAVASGIIVPNVRCALFPGCAGCAG